MNSERRMRRLRSEHERLIAFQARSGLFDFHAYGDPPERYTVTFHCLGMISPVERASEHVAKIYLPAEFPKDPPKVSFLSPCFHPNIMSAMQAPSFQRELERAMSNAISAAERQALIERLEQNEKLWEAHVCLDALDYNWTPAITLDEVLIELAEMIQYKRYNNDDPLNGAAAHWAAQHRHLLPIDHRELLDFAGMKKVDIRILADQASGRDLAGAVAIRILE